MQDDFQSNNDNVKRTVDIKQTKYLPVMAKQPLNASVSIFKQIIS